MILPLLATALASATQPLSDAVAAMVGDQPIFVSDVSDAIRYQSQANPAIANLAPTLRVRHVLGQLIDDKILVMRAKAETLEVSEAEVNQRVDQRVSEMAERAGGMDALAKALRARVGLTVGQYKLRLSRQTREERLKEKLRDKYVGKVEPTREEVLSFHREYRDSMPMLPDQVKLSQITLKVGASPERDSAARAKAAKAIERLRQGADFAALAGELSQDPGSKGNGGDIGYMKRGELDPAYEKAALNLETGRYTQSPVRSRFGWHVILLEGSRDQEFRTRHILFALLPDATDSARTQELADSIRRAVDAGADFAALARRYSAEKASASFGGVLGWYPEGELQGQFKDIVAGIPTGKVGSPVPAPEGLVLLRVDERLQSRRLTPEEDWNRLVQLAGQVLSNKRLSVWLDRWKQQYPVDERISAEEIAARIGS